jgi:hypothetical protein
VQLFGVGTKSASPAITAQRRINCYVERRQEDDRTAFSLIGRPGLQDFVTSTGSSPTRGMWAVNTLTTPLLFFVQASTLYSADNSGNVTTLGTLSTTLGDISMADDGTYLVIVDGFFGYVYNMVTTTLTQITDGNFTTAPRTVTWLDGYFIVTASNGRQFQLSQISPSIDPTVWPAIQIGFAGSGSGNLRGGIVDHLVLNLFGDVYTEFWQDTGSPDFPFSKIPGAAQQFGLAAPWSISQFDNSLVALFQDRTGNLTIARMQGFSLKKISDVDIDGIISRYMSVVDAKGFGFSVAGHPMYLINFIGDAQAWCYDGLSGVWSEWQASNGTNFLGTKFANFVGQQIVSDRTTGNLYALTEGLYLDGTDPLPMEVISKHIWNDDKYIGISQLQIDIESGVGTVSGQGVNPVCDLLVSKDGGNTFTSVGYASMGKLGEFTHRLIWRNLGAARDWVLKLRITDPVKRVITGASAEMTNAPF